MSLSQNLKKILLRYNNSVEFYNDDVVYFTTYYLFITSLTEGCLRFLFLCEQILDISLFHSEIFKLYSIWNC